MGRARSKVPARDKCSGAEIMTAAERRERARLRSERWRRAHGIGPRRPAQKPWLAEGISRRQSGACAGGCGGYMCHASAGYICPRRDFRPRAAGRTRRGRAVQPGRGLDHWRAWRNILRTVALPQRSLALTASRDSHLSAPSPKRSQNSGSFAAFGCGHRLRISRKNSRRNFASGSSHFNPYLSL
jgi:hypothetical protein